MINIFYDVILLNQNISWYTECYRSP